MELRSPLFNGKIRDSAPALAESGTVLSYGELRRRAHEKARELWDSGVRRRSLVAIRGPSDAETAVLAHALWALGAVHVPLNARWTAAEIENVLGLIGNCFYLSRETGEGKWDLLLRQRSMTGEDLSAVQLVLFTSGTTGRPKAAKIPFCAVEASCRLSAQALGLGEDIRWLCPLPLYHIAGLSILYRCAFSGGTVLLQSTFDPLRVREALEREAATAVSLVPTQLYRLLEGPLDPPKSLGCILLGGAKAPSSLLARALERGLPLAPTYGMTETASQVCTLPPRAFLSLPGIPENGLFLPPLPEVETSVNDPSGTPLAEGSVGAIRLRGPTLFAGYLGDPSATEGALAGGWLNTGDVGMRRADGSLCVLDRRSDLIVTGGENVYPAEVEEVLLRHPDVIQAAVVGLPDERWGQQVAAALVVQGDISVEELESLCRKSLADFKRPRRWTFVAELPVTTNGKVQRGKVREILMASR